MPVPATGPPFRQLGDFSESEVKRPKSRRRPPDWAGFEVFEEARADCVGVRARGEPVPSTVSHVAGLPAVTSAVLGTSRGAEL